MDGDRPDPSAERPEKQSRETEADPAADEIEDGPGLFSRLFGLWPKATNGDASGAPSATTELGRRQPRARREMIERVIDFGEKRVEDVMAPRADIVAVGLETPLDQLVRTFADAEHSRMPIFRGDLDDPLGMVHIKDVMALVAKPERVGKEPVLRQIRRDLLYVPPSMRITDLLLRMQASRIHMALVIDEYGGTDGLVTIEDLIEEIVGEINDEHDRDEAPTVVPRPGGGWEADARIELAELASEIGVAIDTGEEDADTLGGLVIALAGRVPQRGEVISQDGGFDFEVIEADARKIRKILIRRRPVADGAPQI